MISNLISSVIIGLGQLAGDERVGPHAPLFTVNRTEIQNDVAFFSSACGCETVCGEAWCDCSDFEEDGAACNPELACSGNQCECQSGFGGQTRGVNAPEESEATQLEHVRHTISVLVFEAENEDAADHRESIGAAAEQRLEQANADLLALRDGRHDVACRVSVCMGSIDVVRPDGMAFLRDLNSEEMIEATFDALEQRETTAFVYEDALDVTFDDDQDRCASSVDCPFESGQNCIDPVMEQPCPGGDTECFCRAKNGSGAVEKVRLGEASSRQGVFIVSRNALGNDWLHEFGHTQGLGHTQPLMEGPWDPSMSQMLMAAGGTGTDISCRDCDILRSQVLRERPTFSTMEQTTDEECPLLFEEENMPTGDAGIDPPSDSDAGAPKTCRGDGECGGGCCNIPFGQTEGVCGALSGGICVGGGCSDCDIAGEGNDASMLLKGTAAIVLSFLVLTRTSRRRRRPS